MNSKKNKITTQKVYEVWVNVNSLNFLFVSQFHACELLGIMSLIVYHCLNTFTLICST